MQPRMVTPAEARLLDLLGMFSEPAAVAAGFERGAIESGFASEDPADATPPVLQAMADVIREKVSDPSTPGS